ncbi:hypothetical protein Q7C_1008 [Methylophaga frappieri]|uniref:Cytoskeleton protein RodZ-like C-terminal domain-containing protein n=1 Tax=Methylophaga frappieri (strain ATCC BAA-2434 / DSM 25690 / JAM7) TaxID=754477 RepID=I1YGX7_METFJ|nr:helix-turn-helix domain-containing protein [Methylophaga frappieri]AFJ02170.1 hypothetical protein Q7C_1008 [Methylophaga frappieri]
MTTSQDDIAIVTETPGIGYRLQQAREAKKLSIAEASVQLRLTRTIIMHLEQEAWDSLYSRTYARGYLLGYARFLGLPEDEILADFNTHYGHVDRPTSLLIKQDLPEHNQLPWKALSLFAVVIVLGWLIYQQLLPNAANPAPPFVPERAESTDNDTLSETDLAVSDEDSGIRAYPQGGNETRGVSKITENQAVIPIRVESMPAQMAEQELQNLTAPEGEERGQEQNENVASTEQELVPEQTENVESTEEKMTPEIDATVEVETTEREPLLPGEASLRLRVTEPSWLEVKDNGGNTLLNRVLEQETVDLHGPMPFTVRVGNVAGTEIQFNETVVDMSPYQQSNVARLTLGAE